MRVLLADDDKAARDLAARALETAGHDVTACDDGTTAAAALKSLDGPVDLLITDVEMPGMGGAQLATLVQKAHPTVRILLISGFEVELDNAHASISGQAGKLLKPFTLAQLREAVDQAIS